jgi:O-antigen ligase
MAGLAWVPFWFGSDGTVAGYINAACFGALVLAYEGLLWVRKQPHPVSLKRVGLAFAAFSVVVLWMLIQASTWMPQQLHHPVWQFKHDLGIDLPGSISINRVETYLALLRLLTEGCVFWLFLQLCRRPQTAHSTIQGVAIIGTAYAAYGIVAFYLFPGTVLWFTKKFYLDSVTSSFINRNTYATYAGIGLVCALGAAQSHFVRSWAHAGRAMLRRAAAFLASTTGAGGWWLASALMLSVALVLTGSRGGITASMAGVLAFALLIMLRGLKLVTAIVALLALLSVGFTVFAFGDLLAARLNTSGFEDPNRVAVYWLTILSILDAPWQGFGAGTFASVFPMYRDGSVAGTAIWDRAHNTYLEIVQGLGIPVAFIFLVLLAALWGRCIYAALTRQTSATASVVATAVTVIVALHSFVDFSMQTEAVALTWTALLATGVAQSWSGRISTSAPLVSRIARRAVGARESRVGEGAGRARGR